MKTIIILIGVIISAILIPFLIFDNKKINGNVLKTFRRKKNKNQRILDEINRD